VGVKEVFALVTARVDTGNHVLDKLFDVFGRATLVIDIVASLAELIEL